MIYFDIVLNEMLMPKEKKPSVKWLRKHFNNNNNELFWMYVILLIVAIIGIDKQANTIAIPSAIALFVIVGVYIYFCIKGKK